MRAFGNSDGPHGFAASVVLKGSLRSVMYSGNIFSPRRVPPPCLLKNDCPCSASRAPKLPPTYPTRSLTATGSRITVYFPGSSFLRSEEHTSELQSLRH